MNFLEHRIPPPLVFLVFAMGMAIAAWLGAAMALAPALRWGVVGLFILAAAGLAPPAVIAFRRAQTTVNPVQIDKASSMVTDGPFRYTRNPMYLGLTSLLVAWAFALSSPLTLLSPLLFALFITQFQIVPEERMMREKFGAAYDHYCGRVRRWI